MPIESIKVQFDFTSAFEGKVDGMKIRENDFCLQTNFPVVEYLLFEAIPVLLLSQTLTFGGVIPNLFRNPDGLRDAESVS